MAVDDDEPGPRHSVSFAVSLEDYSVLLLSIYLPARRSIFLSAIVLLHSASIRLASEPERPPPVHAIGANMSTVSTETRGTACELCSTHCLSPGRLRGQVLQLSHDCVLGEAQLIARCQGNTLRTSIL